MGILLLKMAKNKTVESLYKQEGQRRIRLRKEKRKVKNSLCKCGNHKKGHSHSCPFIIDINDDYDFRCKCCSECTYDCEMSI